MIRPLTAAVLLGIASVGPAADPARPPLIEPKLPAAPPSPREAKVDVGGINAAAITVGPVTVNNFLLSESSPNRPDPGAEPGTVVAVQASVVNRAPAAVLVQLVVAGFDADGELVWSTTATKRVDGKLVDKFDCFAGVLPGSLDRTKNVRYRVQAVPATVQAMPVGAVHASYLGR